MLRVRRPEQSIFPDRHKPNRTFEQELVRLTAMGLFTGRTPQIETERRHVRI
jgi:hypothetical protein